MKGWIWYILGILLFLGLMITVEYNQPKRFVWTPTFGQYDHQPFGCAVFDEVLSDAWPEEYWVSRETFLDITYDSINYAVVAIAQHMDLSRTDVNALLELAGQGSKILLAATTFSVHLTDTLHLRCFPSHFRAQELRSYASALKSREPIYWTGDTARYAPRSFQFFPQLFGSYFSKRDSLSTSLAEIEVTGYQARWLRGEYEPDSVTGDEKERASVAFSMPVGEGEIILVSTPLLLTNYGVLDGANAAYALRLLSRMSDLPLIRTEVYGSPDTEPQSPLRYFLSQPSLRWAVYLTMLTILLFMVFTARRRQRPIPVVRDPGNKTLEFTELIGTLYYRKKNHGDLVRKKFTYLAEQLRRHAHIDIEDESDDEALCRQLAQKTGLDEEGLRVLFRGLRPVMREGWTMSEELMKTYIDRMNEIINHL